jgi:uncharacterized protein (DUF1778 family)
MPRAARKQTQSTRSKVERNTINLRVPTETRALIDSAAAALGKSRTEFVLDTARREAIEVLLDQRLFVLSDEEFARFSHVLDNPPPPSPELRKLFATRAPWEE